MAEINEAGYESIRELVNADLTSAQWQYLELQNASNTILWRGDNTGNWTTVATDQVQILEMTVSGQDVIDYGGTLPVDVEQAALKNENTDVAAELTKESFASATLADADDAVVVTFEVEVPQL